MGVWSGPQRGCCTWFGVGLGVFAWSLGFGCDEMMQRWVGGRGVADHGDGALGSGERLSRRRCGCWIRSRRMRCSCRGDPRHSLNLLLKRYAVISAIPRILPLALLLVVGEYTRPHALLALPPTAVMHAYAPSTSFLALALLEIVGTDVVMWISR